MLLLLATAALASGVFGDALVRRYTSPDHQLYVIIRPGNTPDSEYVDVHGANGQMITGWVFSGSPGTSRRVLHAAWSPDSKLFVFTVSSHASRSGFSKYAFVRSASSIRQLE
jgi:hypothetical protein